MTNTDEIHRHQYTIWRSTVSTLDNVKLNQFVCVPQKSDSSKETESTYGAAKIRGHCFHISEFF